MPQLQYQNPFLQLSQIEMTENGKRNPDLLIRGWIPQPSTVDFNIPQDFKKRFKYSNIIADRKQRFSKSL